MKPISISLSPNTEKDDTFLAFKEMFSFKKTKGNNIKLFEKKFQKFFNFKKVYSLNSGRSSLMLILDTLNIQKNDEIIIQAFTCNAVVNPIIDKKAIPIYIDIDKTINIDANKIEEKISKKTKAIIIQHTFGYPGNIKKVKEIAKKHNLYLIEDCAHSLGAKIENAYCGTFGDISFYSFGRDKIISSVYGGMIGVNNKNLIKPLDQIYSKIEYPKTSWTLSQLMHPVLMNVFILPLYNILKIGRIILAISVKLNILSKAVTKKECNGKLPEYFPKKLPNSLAKLANHQFNKLNKFNKHRKKIAKLYKKEINGIFDIKQGAIYMKYPIIVNNSENMLEKMKKNDIFLNDGWRDGIIVPPQTNTKTMQYKNDCMNAEKLVKKILILPTHVNISIKDAKKIINIIKHEKG